MKVLWAAKRHYGPDYECETHYHPFFHYVYLVSGFGSFRVGTDRREMKPHELFATPPHVEHRYDPLSPQGIQTIELKFEISEPVLLSSACKLSGRFSDGQGGIKALLETIILEGMHRREHFAEMIDLKARELLYMLVRAAAGAGVVEAAARMGEAPAVSNKNLSEAVAYIEENYQEPIDLQKLAGIACYNTSYFCKLFRSEVGTSPIHYVIDKRIEKARELLRETDLNISEVANKVGFESLHYFSRCFAGREGVSPAKYRKRYGTNIYIEIEKNPHKLFGITTGSGGENGAP